MTPKQRVLVAVSIGVISVFVLSACTTVGEQLAPVASPPRLTGTWKGDWGGNMQHPIELVVEKQDRAVVSGTMTFIAHRTSTHRMTGRIGAKQDGTGTSHTHQGPVIVTGQ